MNEITEVHKAWFVGWDWAKNKHQLSVVDASGREVEQWEAAHTAEGLRDAVERLKRYEAEGGVAVSIETPHGLFVEALLEAGITVYALHATAAKRLREALAGESKNDVRDAWSLAESLRLHHRRWTPLKRDDEVTRRLQVLTREEQLLVDEINRLGNRLQATLGQYYPQALELFEQWGHVSAWDFVLQWSTPQAFQKASWRSLEKFLHVHRLAKPERLEAWKRIHQKAGDWPMSRVLSDGKHRQVELAARQLRLVQEGLRDYRQQIEALWKEHPDQPIFKSFKGMGARIAPRILSELGTDRGNFPDANSIACYGGVAPRQYQSGKIAMVRCRHAANHTLQHNLYLWARASVLWVPWARAFYLHEKKRGLWSADVYRRLAAKWTRIFWRCWVERQPYDETRWMQSLKDRGSWLYAETLKLMEQPLEPMEAPL